MTQREISDTAASIHRAITDNGRVVDSMRALGINESAAYAYEFVAEIVKRGVDDEDDAAAIARAARVDPDDYRAAAAIY